MLSVCNDDDDNNEDSDGDQGNSISPVVEWARFEEAIGKLELNSWQLSEQRIGHWSLAVAARTIQRLEDDIKRLRRKLQ